MWCEDKYAEFQFRTWNGIMPRQKMPKRKEREVNSFKLQSLYWATEGEGCIVSVGRPNMIYMTLDNTKIKHPSFLRPSNFIVSIFFSIFFVLDWKRPMIVCRRHFDGHSPRACSPTTTALSLTPVSGIPNITVWFPSWDIRRPGCC